MSDDWKDTLSYALVKLAKTHRARAERELRQLGLYPGQELILFRLWDEEGVSQSALAEALCVEPPTVTKMLQRIEKAGLVERRGDPADARLSRVHLTGAGRALAAPVGEMWARLEEATVKSLTDAEQALLKRLFAQMHTDLISDE